jgi:hypothetical protein
MTAEEFFKEKGTLITYENGTYTNDTSIEYIIEYAKLKVTEALKAASENADTIHVRNTNDYEIDKDSILSAYPLENIK